MPFFAKISLTNHQWNSRANFEKPDFLTIFEVSYDPKQWSCPIFNAKFVFSAIFYTHTWILSPTFGAYYGFRGPSKVPFSAFKVGVQENFHWCFLNDLARKIFWSNIFFWPIPILWDGVWEKANLWNWTAEHAVQDDNIRMIFSRPDFIIYFKTFHFQIF